MSPRRHARLVPCLAMGLVVACGAEPQEPQALPATGYADTRLVPAGNEAAHSDLPGVEGFDDLEPALQAQVVVRANAALCNCGCVGHAVNDCLHQHEDCEVALGLARGFVDDALAFQHEAGGGPAAAVDPATDAAPATSGPVGDVTAHAPEGPAGAPASTDAAEPGGKEP